MTKIGENLEKTDKAYNSALNQLKSGRGNLIGQAEKLKNLGLVLTKHCQNLLLKIKTI